MRGHIRQRGKAWEVRVYAGRDTLTGRERVVTRTVHGGKREAHRALTELMTEVECNTISRTTATTAELLDAWFDQARLDFSPKTVRETLGFIERDLKPGVGHVALSKLTAAMLDRFYGRLRSGAGRGRPLSPATIRRLHGILRRALQQGVRWGWLGVNPASSASPPRVPASDIKPPNPTNVGTLIRLAEESDPDFAAFIHLSAATGARRSELCALRWSAVDLGHGVVRIDRGLVIGIDGPVEKDTKTHSSRRVSIDPTTTSVLRSLHDRAVERADACATVLPPNAYVFTGSVVGDVPWYPDSVSRTFRRLCVRAGLDGTRLHDLRHYVATQLLSAGVDVRTVAGRLGHRNAATTLNVYSHFLESTDRHAADVLSDLLRDG